MRTLQRLIVWCGGLLFLAGLVTGATFTFGGEPPPSAMLPEFKKNHPEHSIDLELTLPDPLRSVENGEIDVALYSGSLPSDLASTGTVMQAPVFGSAIAIAYNLPGTSDATLVLSRQLLVDIHTGAVTNWNDSSIRDLNPDLQDRLPNETILVAVNGLNSSINAIFSEALGMFDPAFAAGTPSSPSPNWSDAVSLRVAGELEVALTVSTTPYSLGRLSLMLANERDLIRAQLVNVAGTAVSPLSRNIGYALMEFGGSFDENFGVSLIDGLSRSAYPICYYVNVILKTQSYRDDCDKLEGAMDLTYYLLYLSLSEVVADLIGVENLPRFVFNQVGDALQSKIFCNGELLAYTELELLGLGSASVYSSQFTYVQGVMTSLGPFRDIRIYSNQANLLPAAERYNVLFLPYVDFLVETYRPAFDSIPDTYGTYPWVISSTIPLFRLDAIGDAPLVLHLQTLGGIFLGDVTNWRDPAILATNPHLETLLPNMTITVVVNSEVSEATFEFCRSLALSVAGFLDRHPPYPIDIFPSSFIRQSSDTRVQNYVLATDGAIGFSLGGRAPILRVPQIMGNTGEVVEWSSSSLSACADGSFDQGTNTIDMNSAPPTCWPLAFPVVFSVPKAFTGVDCERGGHLIRSLARLFELNTTPRIVATLSEGSLGPLPDAINHASALAVGATTCDGEPIIPARIECLIGEGRVSDSECVACAQGTFSPDVSGVCRNCPTGGVCDNSIVPGATRNYWQGNSYNFYRCNTGACCQSDSPCYANSSLIPAAQVTPLCHESRDQLSPMCGKCRDDLTPWFGACLKSDGVHWGILILAFIGAISVNLILTRVASSEFALFKLWTDFTQIGAMLMTPARKESLSLDLLAFDFSELGTIGEVPPAFPSTELISAILPATWPVALLALLGLMYSAEKRILRWRGQPTLTLKVRYVDATWRLVLIGFTVIVATAFRLIHCVPVNDFFLVNTHHGIRCFTPGHSIIMSICILIVVVMCLVVPTMVVFIHFVSVSGEHRLSRTSKRVAAWIRPLVMKSKAAHAAMNYTTPQSSFVIRDQRRSSRRQQILEQLKSSKADTFLPDSDSDSIDEDDDGRGSVTPAVVANTESVGPPVSAKLSKPPKPSKPSNSSKPSKQQVVVPSLGKAMQHGSMPALQVVRLQGRVQPFQDAGGEFGAWIRASERVYYEAFFLVRRVIVVIFALFIQNPEHRQLVIFLIVVMFATFQLRVHPYALPSINALGDLTLLSLTAMAGIEIVEASYEVRGEPFDRSLELSLQILFMLPTSVFVVMLLLSTGRGATIKAAISRLIRACQRSVRGPAAPRSGSVVAPATTAAGGTTFVKGFHGSSGEASNPSEPSDPPTSGRRQFRRRKKKAGRQPVSARDPPKEAPEDREGVESSVGAADNNCSEAGEAEVTDVQQRSNLEKLVLASQFSTETADAATM